jgi:hypothetical protein
LDLQSAGLDLHSAGLDLQSKSQTHRETKDLQSDFTHGPRFKPKFKNLPKC